MKVVLDMQDRRPVWAMPDWVADRLRDALPRGGHLWVAESANDGSGDGAAFVAPAVLEAVRDADVYLGHGIPPEILQAGRSLRWVHSGAAGVRGSLTPAMLESEVVFTNSAGIHAEPMAETALAMILYFVRGLDLAAEARSRAQRRWDPEPFYEARTPVTELARSTVAIVGLGGVGRAIATRCAAMGARVMGVRRGARSHSGPSAEAPAEEAAPDTLPDAWTVEVGEAGLERVLKEADIVVLCLPETAETRHLIDRRRLSLMKPGALLINLGRGSLVVSEALREALAGGALRGVGLDVFDPEPIADDDPILDDPRVLATPHVSAVTRSYWERETALLIENLGHFSRGEPLLNVVDRLRGY